MPISRPRIPFALSSFAGSIALALAAIPVDAPAFPVRWADGVAAHAPGPDDLDDPNLPPVALGDPNAALGPPDSGWVTLGEEGATTLSFSLPFGDIPGDDFAVFENPFIVAPEFGGGVFGELAFVEVSSDGASFARFPSAFGSLLGDFGIILEPELVSGLAGLRSVAQGGDVFDLAVLATAPEVIAGDVDLAAIAYVRLVDIVGDGATLDSLGNPILDPWPTASEFRNSGFELDAVGVIPEPSSAALLGLSALGLVAVRRVRGRAA
jgi:hypothetical protein